MKTLNLGFLCSHGGSNMQAIIDNVQNGKLNANLCAMITNNSQSGAMEKAKKYSIPAYHVSEKTHPNSVDNEIIKIFKSHVVDIIVLAGYMKKISSNIINSFAGRILNIHPALLPKFGGANMYGINVHKMVLETGEKISGATVHLANSAYDSGRILGQTQIDVLQEDTPDTLAARVLAIEHTLYSDVLIKISTGQIVID